MTSQPESVTFQKWRDGILFGNGLRTYLIVDASLRREVTGAFDLDQLDVPSACLFDGAAAIESAQAAPYILDLTPPADLDAKMPKAITNYLDRHWGQKTGIIVRSFGTLDEIKKHLRYFLRLKREDNGRWVLFRFWDARVALPYFEHLAHLHARAAAWFYPKPDPLISQVVIEGESSEHAWIITPDPHLLREAVTAGRPRRTAELTNSELAALGAMSAQSFYHQASREMLEHVSPNTAYRLAQPRDREAYLRMVGRFAEAQGLNSRQAIVKLGLLSLVLGINFSADRRYEREARDAINRYPASEAERLAAALDLFETIKPRYDADGGAPGTTARILSLINEGEFGEPVSVLRRIIPAQVEGMLTEDLTALIAAFLHRYPQVRGLPDEVQIAAMALMAGFGSDWPSNPLYNSYWFAIFEPNWKLRLVNLLLVSRGSESAGS